MEWMNRGNRPAQAGSTPGAAPAPASVGGPARGKDTTNRGLQLASVGLLFAGTLLVVAVLAFIAFGGDKSNSGGQAKYLDKSKFQAVFLNGGQVYFGKVGSIDDKSLSMSDIYYLRVNQTVQPNGQASGNQDISLVKLGCELHGPQDRMVINQSQVIFWENLKSDGQVAKAVEKYKADNPNGQKCDTATTNNSSSNGASTNSNNSSNSSTTNNSSGR